MKTNMELPNHLRVTAKECNQGGAQMKQIYRRFYSQRKQQYPNLIEPTLKWTNPAVEKLKKDGFAVMEGAADLEKISLLREELDRMIRDKESLGKPNEYFVQVRDPLLVCKPALDLALSQVVREVSTEYFEAQPSIGTLNLRRSLKNNLKEHNFLKHGNLFFHYDNNSPWFLKFFFYLNDVDMSGGPFVYVQGSHLDKMEKIPNWRFSKRYSDEFVEQTFGKERIKYLTAKAGDVIVANTRGLHKGLKVQKTNRDMLTVNLLIHPEVQNQKWNLLDTDHGKFSIKKEWFNELPDDVKPFVDFLIKK
mgnify:CR=1 FL=1|tara:strand:+ start:166 stop:1083 length:918 start_codon:yes stop_codon:yes gene_type:complete